MSKLKKVSEWIISIFVVIVFIVSAFAMIGAINGSKTGVSSVFGKTINSVQSDSMKDVLFEGDLIIGDVYEGEALEKGQIITFRQLVGKTYILNTHRIVSVELVGETYLYQTQGDNEMAIDPGYRSATDIVAVYDFRIPGLGGFIDWVKTPVGFIVCVIIPIVAVILYEAYKIVSVILKARDEKLVAESVEATSDDVKAEIIKQYLASQEGAKKEQTEDGDKPSDNEDSPPQGE